ncbi:M15 family metallopeptidase [Rhodococcus tibetensis]|uniref:M15 family metallopeptidase n=1 Tax=Rhodococcus tibetensis TaxID=2965064 RepID=A0ABT1QDY0_9NOCA|nr:M15 family metallopeptidase [Rhodococcus sp. FXJ9.536]MCQ4120412.1 M15 family metallopeptidase [Rhodococcus sp. FXJ9.536]
MTFRIAYGNTHSENGWRMCDHNETVTVKLVPASPGAPVRSGAAATILNAWLLWYHRNVEPVTSQVWGWSRDNAVPNSNHLSGTAFDINAPKYPWGARTMPRVLIDRVNRGLDLFEGTVYWGARWSRADEMHYQIGYPEGDRRVQAFADRLSAGHLGIYGPDQTDTRPTPEVPDMTPEQDRLLRYVAEQLGPWSQLGKNAKGQDLTLVDAVAQLRHDVAELRGQE